MDPRTVTRTMRSILKLQVSDSSMKQEVVRYIFHEELLVKNEWPGWVIKLTPKGIDYLQENEPESEYEE